MKLWNERHPEERFSSMRAFRQACLRAEEWLGIRERSERVGKKPEVKELFWYLEEDDPFHEDTYDDNP